MYQTLPMRAALTVDNAGNVFFGATFFSTATFLSQSLDAGGSQNAATFIAEVSGANGDLLSGQVLPCGNMGYTQLYRLGVDGSGNLFAIGDFGPGESETVSFGNFTLNSQVNGGSYFVRFDSSSGEILAATAYGPSDTRAFFVDSSGNIDLTGGVFGGPDNLDPTGGNSTVTVADPQNVDVFVEQADNLTAPTVTAVRATSGPNSGGTTVTITGNNLTGATTVSFGSTAATSFVVNSPTQITAVSPAGSGVVDIQVITATGHRKPCWRSIYLCWGHGYCRHALGLPAASPTATINVTGTLQVDSSSASAVNLSGNADVNAAHTLIVGGDQVSGNAHFTMHRRPMRPIVADPLADLPAPTGGANYAAVNLSGNGTLTINPGVYPSITVSGNAVLILNSGIYIIGSGGITISGNATVKNATGGQGVFIYNTGALTVSGDASREFDGL